MILFKLLSKTTKKLAIFLTTSIFITVTNIETISIIALM